MELKVLKEMPYAQAHVRVYDKDIYLFSYETCVAEIHGEWLKINGLFSATTRKHIGAFVREYCNSTYQIAKQIYLDDMVFNYTTGEVVPTKEIENEDTYSN